MLGKALLTALISWTSDPTNALVHDLVSHFGMASLVAFAVQNNPRGEKNPPPFFPFRTPVLSCVMVVWKNWCLALKLGWGGGGVSFPLLLPSKLTKLFSRCCVLGGQLSIAARRVSPPKSGLVAEMQIFAPPVPDGPKFVHHLRLLLFHCKCFCFLFLRGVYCGATRLQL